MLVDHISAGLSQDKSVSIELTKVNFYPTASFKHTLLTFFNPFNITCAPRNLNIGPPAVGILKLKPKTFQYAMGIPQKKILLLFPTHSSVDNKDTMRPLPETNPFYYTMNSQIRVIPPTPDNALLHPQQQRTLLGYQIHPAYSALFPLALLSNRIFQPTFRTLYL